MTLADYIKDFCNKNDISLKQLAEHAQMPRSSLYNMMDSKKTTTLINLAKLAQAMQVHPQHLVQLEWQKYKLAGLLPIPINPLAEPETWFNAQQDASGFVAETIADGSLVRTGETFVKTWRLQNTGNTVWENRWLVCQNHVKNIQNEPSLSAFVDERCFFITPTIDKISIPTTQIGETVDLSVELTAPNIPSSAFSYWKMTLNDGTICFPKSIGIYAYVQVVSSGNAHGMA